MNTVKLQAELQLIADADVKQLVAKEDSYNSSWKKRGGIGAFMMLGRKWDRIEAAAEANRWDIFDAIFQDKLHEEGVLDDIRDLRGYLMLVEHEICFNLLEESHGTRYRKANSSGSDSSGGSEPTGNAP